MGQRLFVCSHGLRWEPPFYPPRLIVLAVGAIWSKERVLGRFRSFRGIHGRGDVPLPQFIDGFVCMGSYRRGDTLWDITDRRLQNANNLCPLRSSPFVICYRYGHRSRHQDAIRLFGLLGSCCSILTGVLGA